MGVFDLSLPSFLPRNVLEFKQMSKDKKIHIGTSGWYYQHWLGSFYPPEMKSRDFLNYYSRNFSTTEINNSFYQLPAAKTFINWQKTVPADFLFAVKASRYLTHMKKLKDSQQSLEKFIDRVSLLKDKLGPILFQLPPRWNVNAERLDNFLKALPKSYRYAFEFRNQSWFEEEIKEILKKHQAAFCIYDLENNLSPKWITANFSYIRLHGPEKLAYQGKYSQKELKDWAAFLKRLANQGKEVFCYFDNDQKGYATENALMLKKILQ